jgi:hypothetical protein
MSTSTYSQHIASLKHKQRRKELLENEKKKTLKKSNSSASSSFSVLSYGTQESGSCIICSKESKDMQDHLLEHNFPPFRENCRKPAELKTFVASIIQSGECLYCGLVFTSADSARQHMVDVGHGMLNTRYFDKYEKFYVWNIQEAEQEEENSEEWEHLEEILPTSAAAEAPSTVTLQDLEAECQQRIVLTKTGAKIGQKHIGVRSLRQYYRQYFREIKWIDRNLNMAIEDKENNCSNHQMARQFIRKTTGKKLF